MTDRLQRPTNMVANLANELAKVEHEIKTLEKHRQATEKKKEWRGELDGLAGKVTALENQRAEVQHKLAIGRWLLAEIQRGKEVQAADRALAKIQDEILRLPEALRQLKGERPPLALQAETGDTKGLADLDVRLDALKKREVNLQAAARMATWSIKRKMELFIKPLIEARIKAGEELTSAEAALFTKIDQVRQLEWKVGAIVRELGVNCMLSHPVAEFELARLAAFIEIEVSNPRLRRELRTLAEVDEGTLGKSLRNFEEVASKLGPGAAPVDIGGGAGGVLGTRPTAL